MSQHDEIHRQAEQLLTRVRKAPTLKRPPPISAPDEVAVPSDAHPLADRCPLVATVEAEITVDRGLVDVDGVLYAALSDRADRAYAPRSAVRVFPASPSALVLTACDSDDSK
jgi:hypothetical protein